MKNCHWMAALLLPLVLAGCGGGGGDNAAPGEPGPALKTRFDLANGCYTLRAGERFISRTEDGYGAGTEAAKFYLKPTALGSYLLLSDYDRAAGEIGRKELLGLDDPFGVLTGTVGGAVIEGGNTVAGVGDMSEYFTDPVLLTVGGVPRPIRIGGETVSGIGDLIVTTPVAANLGVVTEASDLAVWKVTEGVAGKFIFTTALTDEQLTIRNGALTLIASATATTADQFEAAETAGCDAYPEAGTDAVVAPGGPAIYLKDVALFDGVEGLDDDDIYGFVDAHSHISAYEFIGGRINYGDPFHKFGVDHALADCEENHGPMGLTGVVEFVTSQPEPHETQGWPTFNFWPVNNSLQHHQSYYKWIERAHLAGQKILVNHLVHNDLLCQLNPQKQNDCDNMPAILLQAQRMHEMQDYIDAQAGGPGKGFFQIVKSPAHARAVIAKGQMAVILGVEESKVLDCGEFLDQAECTREQIVERLDQLQAVDVRSLFPVHKFDNAFGGHLPDLGSPAGISGVLYAGNFSETGHPIEYETCPAEEYAGDEPGHQTLDTELPVGLIEQLFFQASYLFQDFPAGPPGDPRVNKNQLCNARGLTELGEFLIDELMRRKMLIETDHISRKAMARILEITGARNYPVVNSHGGWGATQALRNRVAVQGGMTNDFAGGRDGLLGDFLRNGRRPRPDALKVGPFGGAGFASDVNGIASLPGQPGAAVEGFYPFTSVDGRVTFSKSRTGDREFGIYDGRGVAHYGLYPDLIADMQKHSQRSPDEVKEALSQFFTSAEAYLRMWEQAEAAGGAAP